MIEFGTLWENGYIEWEFSDESPLLGLYGHQKNSYITQLGVITLNKACYTEEQVNVEVVVIETWYDDVMEVIRQNEVYIKFRDSSLA